MTIHWIKCSERMPPDDIDIYVILRKIGEHKLSLYNTSIMRHWLRNNNSYEWIPYDEATWRELNK